MLISTLWFSDRRDSLAAKKLPKDPYREPSDKPGVNIDDASTDGGSSGGGCCKS